MHIIIHENVNAPENKYLTCLHVQPRATFKFPAGELTLEERENELKRVLSVSGIVKGQILNGLCTAQFKEDELNLRYAYKVHLVELCFYMLLNILLSLTEL